VFGAQYSDYSAVNVAKRNRRLRRNDWRDACDELGNTFLHIRQVWFVRLYIGAVRSNYRTTVVTLSVLSVERGVGWFLYCIRLPISVFFGAIFSGDLFTILNIYAQE
jgi:hypothetical protein